MTKKMLYFGYQKLMVYTVLVIMAIQLIYFNSSYGFVHLILYFLFIMTQDVYKTDYRNIKLEVLSTILYLVAPVLLIASSYLGLVSSYTYYALIIVLAVINMKLIWEFKKIYINKEFDKINDRNIKMFKREGKFLIIYSYVILIILLGIIGQAVYSIINL
jgi:hypothetical protein